MLIEKIAIGGVDYTLVVTPTNSANADPYLRRAHETTQQVDLGWIGVGYVPVDPAQPRGGRSKRLDITPKSHAGRKQHDCCSYIRLSHARTIGTCTSAIVPVILA